MSKPKIWPPNMLCTTTLVGPTGFCATADKADKHKAATIVSARPKVGNGAFRGVSIIISSLNAGFSDGLPTDLTRKLQLNQGRVVMVMSVTCKRKFAGRIPD